MISRTLLAGLAVCFLAWGGAGCGNHAPSPKSVADAPSPKSAAGAAEIFYAAYLNHYELGRMREQDWKALAITTSPKLLSTLRREADNVPTDPSARTCAIKRQQPRRLSSSRAVVAAVQDCGGQRVVGLGLVFVRGSDDRWRVETIKDARNAAERAASTSP